MNPAKQPIALHVLSSQEDSATRRLHLLMRQRETLRPMFRSTWDDLSHHFDATELDDVYLEQGEEDFVDGAAAADATATPGAAIDSVATGTVTTSDNPPPSQSPENPPT